MPKKSNSKQKYIFFTIILLILIVAIFIVIKTNTKSTKEQSYSQQTLEAFAECLTSKGFTMYGTDWCPHCKAQKEMFGIAFTKINYINCDFNKELCQEKGIRGYPTWLYDNETKRLEGTQPLETLALVSGCDLNGN